MSELDYTKAFQRLKLENDFKCIDVDMFTCKKCEYFYQDEKYKISKCLKQNVLEWALYHIDAD